MLNKNKIRKSVTAMTLAAVWCMYSTVAFALPKNVLGEITVSGQVTMNGEPVVTDSTVFSGSTIATADNAGAVVVLGKLGRLQIGSKATFVVSFQEGSVNGDLTSGSLTVLDAVNAVHVKTLSGTTVDLKAGDTVSAEGVKTSVRDDDKRDANGKCVDTDKDGKLECDDDKGAIGWWVWATVIGGSAVVVALIARSDDSFGSGSVVVSPTR